MITASGASRDVFLDTPNDLSPQHAVWLIQDLAKVTRIASVRGLNAGKLAELAEIAQRLGRLRTEVWDCYGSIGGVGVRDRTIRDRWLAEGRCFDVPARLWKETLRDVIDDIKTYREAAKVKARECIRRRTKDEDERKRLYSALKYDKWLDDPYLRRIMRRYCKHGRTAVGNQIVLDSDCYNSFERNGRTWIKVMGLQRGQRIAIPTNVTVSITGTIRLILRSDVVDVHYTIEEKPGRPSGDATIGIDKGYTEAFTDDSGLRYGEGLGKVLSAESDYLKAKYQRRNKLTALAEAHDNTNPAKANRIRQNNLGRKKLDRRKTKHRKRVRDVVYKAAHQIADRAHTVAVEDLTAPIRDKKRYGKNQSRRLSGWVKGVMAEALEDVSRRRGSAVRLVNAAYTSQIDSRTGLLNGERDGERFYCSDGVVLDADQNAARNVLARLSDPEIGRWTPYQKVKAILQERLRADRRGLALPGHELQAYRLSTMSELPETFTCKVTLTEQLCLDF